MSKQAGKGPEWRSGTNFKNYWDNFPDMRKTLVCSRCGVEMPPEDLNSYCDHCSDIERGIDVDEKHTE